METVIYCLFCLMISSAACFSDTPQEDVDFQTWKAYYGKQYSDAVEEELRWKVWLVNKAFIDDYNKDNPSFQLELNELADTSGEELAENKLGHDSQIAGEHLGNKKQVGLSQEGDLDLSMTIDWRDYGVITPVEDQGRCGACWAFSATGALESRYAIQTGNLLSFSEQHLLDCSIHNGGCKGGWSGMAFQDAAMLGGVNTDDIYPYKAAKSTCKTDNTTLYASPTLDSATRRAFVQPRDESELLEALQQGPVSISMDVGNPVFPTFHFYKSAVGFDVDYSEPDNPQPYWIVKNSWNAKWGNHGYIHIAAGVNICGLMVHSTYPLLPFQVPDPDPGSGSQE